MAVGTVFMILGHLENRKESAGQNYPRDPSGDLSFFKTITAFTRRGTRVAHWRNSE